MLATFVIGLREGLEAALIVGIIAAFLRQSGRSDALRKMWVGVAVAVVLCLAVGLILQSVNSNLPQRQQEMLECLVAAIAVVMVSYMVLWMRTHSRSLEADLHEAAGGALASGSATALVVMAFLAVFREGFETAVFLLAAFQSAVSPAQAVVGAVLGVVIAVGLGYLIYRGGVKLNLSRFFRMTGVVLVLVAAGLVMSTLRAAYEAGWLTIGQQQAVSLSLSARLGTVQESLLTGVLGIRSSMPVIEVIAYLLYLVPMLAVVLWPARKALTGLRLGRILAGAAALAIVVAAALVVLAPSPTNTAAASLAVTSTTSATDLATGDALPAANSNGTVAAGFDASHDTLTLSDDGDGAVPVGRATLQLAGSVSLPGLSAAKYIGTPVSVPVDASAGGLPATLTLKQVAALGDGRLPIGMSVDGSSSGSVEVSYTDAWTPTATVDPNSGTVLGLDVTVVRSITLTSAAGGTYPGGEVATIETVTTDAAVTNQLAVAIDIADSRADHELLGEVIPGLLGVFAMILLGFGLPHLLRRRPDRVSDHVPAPDGRPAGAEGMDAEPADRREQLAPTAANGSGT
ncbi:high-affinity iron transporter [Nakamurella sp. UYEF19]|uniref:iron uptake transporter permease EfeU n=1 Tax=Nakamurella sp. UYEF19 TaxID=1756392 RepID=UPI0033917F59